MAEVQLLSPRSSQEGTQRLAGALEQALIANADLGPRWPQIRALGPTLQQLSQDLDREVERLPCRLDVTPGVEAFRDSRCQLSEAFSRLGSVAEPYPAKA